MNKETDARKKMELYDLYRNVEADDTRQGSNSRREEKAPKLE